MRPNQTLQELELLVLNWGVSSHGVECNWSSNAASPQGTGGSVLASALPGCPGAAPNRWPMEAGCFWGGKEVSCGRVLLDLWAEAWSLAGLGRHGRGIGRHGRLPGGCGGPGAEARVVTSGLQELLASTKWPPLTKQEMLLKLAEEVEVRVVTGGWSCSSKQRWRRSGA